ncbi:MAG: PCRF domain-containing protein, partial [Patescibacteria group bacterium]|nr:PCRF domain-containing protein [Patescibacteria group bacterium]
MQDIINKVKKEYSDISEGLNDPNVSADPQKMITLSKKQAELMEVMEKITEYEKITTAMKDNAEIVNTETDDELKQMAMEENLELAPQISILEKELEVLLLPKDPDDTKNVIVEIRGGAGGDESALFGANLFRMYSRFAEKNNWKVDIIHSNATGIGGYKEIVFEINAPSNAEPVYKYMKYESGVHRVQRIPETEKQGRIHTSTATVAV